MAFPHPTPFAFTSSPGVHLALTCVQPWRDGESMPSGPPLTNRGTNLCISAPPFSSSGDCSEMHFIRLLRRLCDTEHLSPAALTNTYLYWPSLPPSLFHSSSSQSCSPESHFQMYNRGAVHASLWLRLWFGMNPGANWGEPPSFKCYCMLIHPNICFTLSGILFHCHNKLMRTISLLLFGRWGNWGSKKLSNLIRVTSAREW